VSSDQRARIQRDFDPHPWADGDRSLYFVLHIRQISGRVVGRDWRAGFETGSEIR
jgi:hypothetical protein